jgi:hypothetical protein
MMSRPTKLAPSTSARRPCADRRHRSIWNSRSCACTNPWAKKRSSWFAAVMCGTPHRSRTIETGARRRLTAMEPETCGSGRGEVGDARCGLPHAAERQRRMMLTGLWRIELTLCVSVPLWQTLRRSSVSLCLCGRSFVGALCLCASVATLLPSLWLCGRSFVWSSVSLCLCGRSFVCALCLCGKLLGCL